MLQWKPGEATETFKYLTPQESKMRFPLHPTSPSTPTLKLKC